MLPAVTPSIIGVSIFMSPPKKSAEGSSMGSSAADSAAARSSNSGRYASIVWCAHNARVTGSASRGRPVLDGVSPVAWLTCSSATADELFEVDASQRIDVRLGLAFARDGDRELARCLPAEGALTLDHLGDVGEERDSAERVLWTLVAHTGMVEGWSSSPSLAQGPIPKGARSS